MAKKTGLPKADKAAAKKATPAPTPVKKVEAAAQDTGRMIDQKRYERIAYVDKEGKTCYSAGNGDAIGIAMLGMNLTDLEKVVKVNKLGEHFEREFANVGQMRMALGNRLRAIVRKEGTVVVGKHEITSLNQKIEAPDLSKAGKKASAGTKKANKEEKAAAAA